VRGAHSFYSPPGAKNLAVPMNIQGRCEQYGKKKVGFILYVLSIW